MFFLLPTNYVFTHKYHRKPPKPNVPERKFGEPLQRRSKLWLSLAQEYAKRAKESASKPLQGIWEALVSSKDGGGETLTIAEEDQPSMLDIMDEALT